MTGPELKEVGDLLWKVFAEGHGGERSEALMSLLIARGELDLAMQFLLLEALDLVSIRLSKMITVMEESELWKMRSQK